MRPRVLALVLALAGAVAAHGEDSERLQALLDSVTGLSADFEQVVSNRFGEALQISTGRLALAPPSRLRWEVDSPYPQLVLADGESLWIYDPDLEQVQVRPLAAAIEGSPAVLLGRGETADLAQFDVVAEPPAADGGLRFALTPSAADSVYRRIRLGFSAEGRLALLVIEDQLEQTTRIDFREVVYSPVLDSSLFEFDVPDAIDVVGDVPGKPATD